VDQQGYNLTNETVANLLSVLAKGQSKLATPGWPKFTDSYRSYDTFKEDLEAYLRDYGHGVSERTLAQQIKQHCLSKATAEYVEFSTTPTEILSTLSGLFARPARLIDSLMDPIKKAKKVQLDDWPAFLGYYVEVKSMFQEVRRLKVFNLFSNVSNVDSVLEKLSTAEVERWIQYSEGKTDGDLAPL
jgi:hypothetical protein